MSIQKINNSNDYKQWSIITGVDMLGNYHALESSINTPVDLTDLDSSAYTITATGTGASSALYLPEGMWNLFFTCSSWGDTDLEISHDGTTWFDALDSSEAKVNYTANGGTDINGSVYIRLNVNTYTADIVLTVKKYL